MKKNILILSAIVCITLTSCEQIMTRSFGGTMTIDVPNGMKVTSATWKGTDLFYFVEEMESEYIIKKKMLIESSPMGVKETKVIFKETK